MKTISPPKLIILLSLCFLPGLHVQFISQSFHAPGIQLQVSALESDKSHTVVRKLTTYEPEVFRDILAAFGATPDETEDLMFICGQESRYNHLAKNKSSSASGICQYLTSTWAHQCQGDIWSIYDQTRCALQDLRAGKRSQWAVTW